jgi:hypothetical protein
LDGEGRARWHFYGMEAGSIDPVRDSRDGSRGHPHAPEALLAVAHRLIDELDLAHGLTPQDPGGLDRVRAILLIRPGGRVLILSRLRCA